MAGSTGKTVALFLLVFIILILVFGITPLYIGPFGAFTGFLHTIRDSGTHIFSFGPSFLRFTYLSFFSLIFLVLWIMVIIWVYRDAEQRGMNGLLWALLVFIGNLIGLLIYLLVRSDSLRASPNGSITQVCPSCQKSVDEKYVFCPYCGKSFQNLCPECKKVIEKTWNNCPHCGKKLGTNK